MTMMVGNIVNYYDFMIRRMKSLNSNPAGTN